MLSKIKNSSKVEKTMAAVIAVLLASNTLLYGQQSTESITDDFNGPASALPHMVSAANEYIETGEGGAGQFLQTVTSLLGIEGVTDGSQGTEASGEAVE